MSECMPIPDNWKDFVKEYSFKDIREVYTNGSWLIPTFRVEQMMEHFVKPDWVSVKDRLPELYVDVLIFTKGGTIAVDRLERIMSWGEDFYNYGQNVTHWMHLPTPPESEDDEEC